jgi:hypothetical protein
MFGLGSEQNDEPLLMTVDDVSGLTTWARSVFGQIQSGALGFGTPSRWIAATKS